MSKTHPRGLTTEKSDPSHDGIHRSAGDTQSRYGSYMPMMRAPAPDGSAILYGMAPFGWRVSRDRRRLIKDKDEQRVMAVVKHMYYVRRLPMREIVRLLAEMGVRNRRGTPYVLSRIYAIVHDGGETPPEAELRRRRR